MALNEKEKLDFIFGRRSIRKYTDQEIEEDKIEILFNDKSLCKKISKNNLIKSKEYSWDNRAKKLIGFIKKEF